MKIKQFEEILKSGEGTLIEFKKSVSAALGREISAFANTAGGRIFIGIDDNNKITGCTLTNKIKSQIQDIANNCDPRAALYIETIRYEGKDIVLVTVPESIDKPVQCSEGFFLREGPNSQKMTRKEIFYWPQKTRKIRCENQPRVDFKYPGDFDKELLYELLKRMNITVNSEHEDLLQNLGLGENEESFIINNAGILFFGKKRDLYFRQAYVTCVLYKGLDKVKIIDRKDFRTGLVQDYENAIKFLQQHLRLEYVIEGPGPRKEIPEIPYEALKEALLNAIIHRDYFEIGARVMVEIFDDRVEISNPGELLFEKEKFGKKSMARNPIIFDIFNRLGLVEKVGSGIKRIISAVKEQNLKVEFDIDSFFTVIIQRPGIDIPGKSEYRPGYPDVEAVRTLRDHPASTPQVLKILSFCEDPRTRSEIQEYLRLKDREYFRLTILKPLLDDGLLAPLIPDKPRSSKQKYIITGKGKTFLKDH
ncbi:MAG: putative DNA binding domain-containing protein [Candidatus Aminicenantes bacterium]|nr:putative DNA binding domain-containing protein [Candidatus Aminicenantes bacterium]